LVSSLSDCLAHWPHEHSALLTFTFSHHKQQDPAISHDTCKPAIIVMKDVSELANGLHIKSRPPRDAEAAGMDSTAAAVDVSTPISSSSIGTNSSELDPKGHRHTTLLAPIPIEKQLNLRWERICAYVSTDYDEVGVLTKTLQRCRGQEVRKEKKQVGVDC
jgi:hypothetical protein